MKTYLKENRVLLAANVLIAAAFALAFALGADTSFLFSPEAGSTILLAEGAGALELKALEKVMKETFEKYAENLKRTQDIADKALDEAKKLGGTIEAKTNEKLTELGTKGAELGTQMQEVRKQILEIAQKISTVPQGGSGEEQKSIAELVIESAEYKAASRSDRMAPVEVPSRLLRGEAKTQIINATGQNQPLVPSDRQSGLIVPAEQRLYIRDLLPQAITSSNLIEFASEASFTNNARAQGDSSPGGIEGEAFAESAMTFTLSNVAVVTLGHWIPASRQVLSDASMLQGHLGTRLTYGLKLTEESQLLTGTGAAGTITGLNASAAAYSRGVTNDTILDTLLKAMLQVSLSNYEASGYVLHPVDWYTAMLLKDTQNRYLFSDPQSMVAPRVWAKPVVASQTMPQGKFLCGAFNLGAQIWDRETATVRISENVNDHFIKNMVAILVEERLALTIFRSTAFVYGITSHAG